MGPQEAVDATSGALGRPVFAHFIGDASAPIAAIARWRHRRAMVEIEPSEAIRFALSLTDGRRSSPRRDSPAGRVRSGSLSIFSPTEFCRVGVEGEADVAQIFVDRAFVERSTGAPPAARPYYNFHDDRLLAAFLQMLVGAVRGAPDDSMMMEEGLHGIALRLQEFEGDPRPSRGGLTPTALRRVDEAIEAAFEPAPAASPSLEDLANAARLSVSHFVRAFRLQRGLTPHKYLVQRRIERAMAQLRAPGASVADVADQVGYATPAHFVAAFRAATGVTPGAVRDALSVQPVGSL